MKDKFPGYYRPSQAELSELWQMGLFILDTNVLLGLYRYPKQSRDDLMRVFKQISDRLWIPHQVALEFQKRRLGVIAEQIGRYNEVSNVLREIKSSLRTKLDGLQLQKRHSAIQPNDFLKKVDTVFEEFEKQLQTLRKEQPDVSDEDKIREEIDLFLSGKVGEPFDNNRLTSLYKEGEERYKRQQPPGHQDEKEKKDTFYFHNDLVIQQKYGDLIIWQQIIEEVKKHQSKYIVFITDDEKEDWWWKFNGKTIGPRHELTAEIKDMAGVSVFYMYTSFKFLEYARDFLGTRINEESITQIREISELQVDLLSAVMDAVELWLMRIKYPNGTFSFIKVDSAVDFIVNDGGLHIGVDVKYPRDARLSKSYINELLNRGERNLNLSKLDSVKYVIVFDNMEKGHHYYRVVNQYKENLPQGVEIIVGYIDNNQTNVSSPIFVPIY